MQEAVLDVVTRIRNGDQAAFDALFRQYFKPLRRYALTMVHCGSTADDVVQAVFVRLWAGREAWSLRSTVKAYLYAAVHHEVIRLVRHDRVRHRHAEAVLGRKGGEASSPTNWPDSELADRELHRVLKAALEQLPPRTRQAFELHRFQQLSYEEIATVMDISVKTVGVHIGRALVVMRKVLLPYLAALVLVSL